MSSDSSLGLATVAGEDSSGDATPHSSLPHSPHVSSQHQDYARTKCKSVYMEYLTKITIPDSIPLIHIQSTGLQVIRIEEIVTNHKLKLY